MRDFALVDKRDFIRESAIRLIVKRAMPVAVLFH